MISCDLLVANAMQKLNVEKYSNHRLMFYIVQIAQFPIIISDFP
jgi:hypothetical protein